MEVPTSYLPTDLTLVRYTCNKVSGTHYSIARRVYHHIVNTDITMCSVQRLLIPGNATVTGATDATARAPPIDLGTSTYFARTPHVYSLQ